MSQRVITLKVTPLEAAMLRWALVRARKQIRALRQELLDEAYPDQKLLALHQSDLETIASLDELLVRALIKECEHPPVLSRSHGDREDA